MRSTILLIFAILFIFNEGLSQSLQKPIFEKKIKQEINIDYKPFYTFSNIDRIQGTYHPLKLQQSITHTYEITYGSIIKHLKLEVYAKHGAMKFFLDRKESLDSISHPYTKTLASDTIKFHSAGLRIGRVGKIGKRFEYELFFGEKFEIVNHRDLYYGTILLVSVPIVDSKGNIIDYELKKRLECWTSAEHGSKITGSSDLTFRLQYKLSEKIYASAVTSFVFNPVYLFLSKDYNDYEVKYYFYPLQGSDYNQISQGILYSRFTQLHLGIGISYFF